VDVVVVVSADASTTASRARRCETESLPSLTTTGPGSTTTASIGGMTSTPVPGSVRGGGRSEGGAVVGVVEGGSVVVVDVVELLG
jgi:hypothetical protein